MCIFLPIACLYNRPLKAESIKIRVLKMRGNFHKRKIHNILLDAGHTGIAESEGSDSAAKDAIGKSKHILKFHLQIFSTTSSHLMYGRRYGTQ